MGTRYVLPANRRTTIAIDWEVHALLKDYASEKGVSLVEATNTIIGMGIAFENGIEWKPGNEQTSWRS